MRVNRLQMDTESFSVGIQFSRMALFPGKCEWIAVTIDKRAILCFTSHKNWMKFEIVLHSLCCKKLVNLQCQLLVQSYLKFTLNIYYFQ